MRKCGKTSKELPTSAQPPCAQDQNVILPTHKKKSRQQEPPPASRHWSVLTLDHVVPLSDMRANTSNNIYGIMRSSREALPIQKLTTITTNGLSKVEEDPRYVELLVSFYLPAPEDATNNFEKKDFKVIMLRSWTPKIYLGALYQSITSNSLLTLESIIISGHNYTTMNELNWLFHLQKDIIHMRLVTSASYLYNLHDGEFNKMEKIQTLMLSSPQPTMIQHFLDYISIIQHHLINLNVVFPLAYNNPTSKAALVCLFATLRCCQSSCWTNMRTQVRRTR